MGTRRGELIRWFTDLDTKACTLAVLPHIQVWPGSRVRDPRGWCMSGVCAYVDQNCIEEVDVRSGRELCVRPVKGKYNLSISVARSYAEADAELKLARELTAKHSTIAILTTLTWASRMVIGFDEMPDVFVLDPLFDGRTIAWFVWGQRRGGSGTISRLALEK